MISIIQFMIAFRVQVSPLPYCSICLYNAKFASSVLQTELWDYWGCYLFLGSSKRFSNADGFWKASQSYVFLCKRSCLIRRTGQGCTSYKYNAVHFLTIFAINFLKAFKCKEKEITTFIGRRWTGSHYFKQNKPDQKYLFSFMWRT